MYYRLSTVVPVGVPKCLQAPLRGYQKFKRDMALLSAQQERERQEHLCTASPSLTFIEVGI